MALTLPPKPLPMTMKSKLAAGSGTLLDILGL
jgi:hypothetical protein